MRKLWRRRGANGGEKGEKKKMEEGHDGCDLKRERVFSSEGQPSWDVGRSVGHITERRDWDE